MGLSLSTTLRTTLQDLFHRARTIWCSQRPLSAGDLQPEGSPVPIPETIPPQAEDGVPNPAEQLSSVLIPMPPPPRCQYPSEYGRRWMLSLRWDAAPRHLIC